VVEKDFQAPIRHRPIVTKPIAANRPPWSRSGTGPCALSVTVPQLPKDLGVSVRGPDPNASGGKAVSMPRWAATSKAA